MLQKLFRVKKNNMVVPQRTFDVLNPPASTGAQLPAIKCRRCGSISYNQNDVKYLYCGFCKEFHTK